MAGRFLGKLLGKKPTLPADVAAAQAELVRLGEDRPTLAELAGQLHDCLAALYAEPIRVAAPSLAREAVAQKLKDGVSLLRGESLDIDWPALQRRFQEVVGSLAERRADAAGPVADAIRSRKLDIADLTTAILAGQPHGVHERADLLRLDVPLTASVLSLVLLAAFVPIGAGLEPLVSPESWEHGYCPVCGSYPKLGEFRGLEQTRFLRCGLCATQWQFPRLKCAGCGNRDHRQLGYLHVEGEEGKWRAAICEECRQYVKMVSTLTRLSSLQLLVTDVATIHLDLLAADRGYSPLHGPHV